VRLLDANDLRSPGSTSPEVRYLTTGDPARLAELMPGLIGVGGEVHQLNWDGLQLRG